VKETEQTIVFALHSCIQQPACEASISQVHFLPFAIGHQQQPRVQPALPFFVDKRNELMKLTVFECHLLLASASPYSHFYFQDVDQ